MAAIDALSSSPLFGGSPELCRHCIPPNWTTSRNGLVRNTPKDAVFQFGDAERRLEPGVFRARAKRALYVDWKAGGQVNFLQPFAMLWAERWEA